MKNNKITKLNKNKKTNKIKKKMKIFNKNKKRTKKINYSRLRQVKTIKYILRKMIKIKNPTQMNKKDKKCKNYQLIK